MRPGGVRTLQDEINMGLRNKDGSLIDQGAQAQPEAPEEVESNPETTLTQDGSQLPPDNEPVEDDPEKEGE